jgi:hypothetical protein
VDTARPAIWSLDTSESREAETFMGEEGVERSLASSLSK